MTRAILALALVLGLLISPAYAQEQIALADNFDDPAVGFLPDSSPNPTRYEIGYVGGEYVIRRIDASYTGASAVNVPGVFVDARIAVDARLLGTAADSYVRLSCRAQAGTADFEYRVAVRPGTREFRLERRDRGPTVLLQDWRASAAIRGANETNRVELSCVGSRIAASFNGTEVIAIQDDTYSQGRFELGLFSSGRTAEARFDNLVVIERIAPQAPAAEEAEGSPVGDGPAEEPASVEEAAPSAPTEETAPAVAVPSEEQAAPRTEEVAAEPPPPAPTATPAPTPTVTPAARPGDVLLTDNFNDPAAGFLPRSSPDPARYLLGYADGEYMIRRVDASYTGASTADLPGIYGDASIAIDARLVGTPGNAYVRVSCREQAGTDSEYRLAVRPGSREFRLERRDRGRATALLDWRASPAIRDGNQTNRLELICAGDRITASINGVEVGSVADDTYKQGRMEIGLFSTGVTSEARFDNLVVTQR